MKQIRVRIDGTAVRCVHDDDVMRLLQALGVVRVERASNVEYDHDTSEWVARLAGTNTIIARGADRAAVIRAEIKYLEERL